jgi:hypothetical protein
MLMKKGGEGRRRQEKGKKGDEVKGKGGVLGKSERMEVSRSAL